MKARVTNKDSKYYGKIVNVKKMEDSRFFANRYKMIYGKGVFFGDELDFNIEKEHDINSENDWSAFRREAAKAAMEGILASGDGWSETLAEGYKTAEKHSYPIGIARFAVACADELIKQLKEGRA